MKHLRFNLQRWFAVLSFVCIAIISSLSAYGLSKFMTSNLLERDAVVTAEFVQSIAKAQNVSAHFGELDFKKTRPHLDAFFEQMAHLPDVARANVFSRNRTVVWSNDETLVGRRYGDNPELERALLGEVVLKSGRVSAKEKSEHVSFEPGVDRFVENYVPIHAPQSGEVVGVVEVYKIPNVLYATIRKGNMLVVASAIVGGIFLYAALFWVVRRGGRLLAQQQKALVDAERMATVGEMVANIAHGIRNPLSVIRTSAELAEDGGDPKEFSEDVVRETDRIDRWIRELLEFSREPDRVSAAPCSLREVLKASLANFAERLERQEIRVRTDHPADLAPVHGDQHLLIQATSTLISNAVDVMPAGGELTLRAGRTGDTVTLDIIDTGPGIASEDLTEVFKPLVTRKRNGLGMGLPLARRVAERFGGRLELQSSDGAGCCARLTLLVAS